MKYCRGGMTSLDYLIEIQRLENELKKYEWISVKDRLPDKDGKYLVCGKVALSDIHGEPIRLVRFTERKEWLTSLLVKYWMPLPNPPEKPYQEWDRIKKEREEDDT